MEQEELIGEYDKILNIVCEELNIEQKAIMTVSQSDNVKFACGLYLQLIDDCGLDTQRAVALINKARPTIPIYISVVERELKSNRNKYEHYKACCKKLNILAKFSEHIAEMNKLTNEQIKEYIGKLPKNNHYTMGEEIALIRVMESSVKYMKSYGKGLQPLLEGCAITRKTK